MKFGVFVLRFGGYIWFEKRCHGSMDVFFVFFVSKDVVVEVAKAYTRNTFPLLLCSHFMFFFSQ